MLCLVYLPFISHIARKVRILLRYSVNEFLAYVCQSKAANGPNRFFVQFLVSRRQLYRGLRHGSGSIAFRSRFGFQLKPEGHVGIPIGAGQELAYLNSRFTAGLVSIGEVHITAVGITDSGIKCPIRLFAYRHRNQFAGNGFGIVGNAISRTGLRHLELIRACLGKLQGNGTGGGICPNGHAFPAYRSSSLVNSRCQPCQLCRRKTGGRRHIGGCETVIVADIEMTAR